MKILNEKILHRTSSVIDLDNQRKLLLIRAFFQNWLLKPFQAFAGMKGWKIYAGFQSGTMIYLHYFCRSDWRPELSYYLVVLNTAAVEGVSVQKMAVDAGHKFLSEHAFHPQKAGLSI